MSIWGKLFGNDKAIGKAVDGIYNGVDKLIYTPEEKVDNYHKTLKLYEPFKIAQRLLALTFSIPYAIAWFITFTASFWFNVDTQMDLLNGTIGQIVTVIVGFYFLGGVVSGGFGLKKQENSAVG